MHNENDLSKGCSTQELTAAVVTCMGPVRDKPVNLAWKGEKSSQAHPRQTTALSGGQWWQPNNGNDFTSQNKNGYDYGL